jgi:hypothetical protein
MFFGFVQKWVIYPQIIPFWCEKNNKINLAGWIADVAGKDPTSPSVWGLLNVMFLGMGSNP